MASPVNPAATMQGAALTVDQLQQKAIADAAAAAKIKPSPGRGPTPAPK